MYEEYNAHIPDIRAYLDRIGIAEIPEPTIENLNRLIWNHQMHIPFETIDSAVFHIPISLRIDDIFEKLIVRKRGGYCHEQNALLCQLLKDLGYNADSSFGRIIRGADYRPFATHRTIIVKDPGEDFERFVDVGMGGPLPPAAYPLVDGHEETWFGQTFRIHRSEEHWWMMCTVGPDGSETRQLELCDIRQRPEEFIPANYYCSTSPEHDFTHVRIVNQRTENGILSLMHDHLTIHRGQEKTVIDIPDEKTFFRVVEEYFGMTLTAPEAASS